MLGFSNSFSKLVLEDYYKELDRLENCIKKLIDDAQGYFHNLIKDCDYGKYEEIDLIFPPKNNKVIKAKFNGMTVNLDYRAIEICDYTKDGVEISKCAKETYGKFAGKMEDLHSKLSVAKENVKECVSLNPNHLDDFKDSASKCGVGVDLELERISELFYDLFSKCEANLTGFILEGNFISGNDRVESIKCSRMLDNLFWETFNMVNER